MRKFANYVVNKTDSFQASPEIQLMPQFMFYFRKSYFVKKFNTSVDEHSLYKMTLIRENSNNMLVMMQPALFSYEANCEHAESVLCEIESLNPERVLMVDTYFNVCVWHGKTINEWVEAGYHEQEEFSYIKDLL